MGWKYLHCTLASRTAAASPFDQNHMAFTDLKPAQVKLRGSDGFSAYNY